MSETNGNGKRDGRSISEKMLDVLADGMPHTREELFSCLHEQDADIGNIRFHIFHLRKALRPKGQDIVCEIDHRRTYYRHVRLLHSCHDGKR